MTIRPITSAKHFRDRHAETAGNDLLIHQVCSTKLCIRGRDVIGGCAVELRDLAGAIFGWENAAFSSKAALLAVFNQPPVLHTR